MTFEPVGSHDWTENVVLRASTGVDAVGREVEYAVDSGPGNVSGGVLSFSGPGTVVVRATLAGDGEDAPVSVVQTVAVKRVEAKLVVEGKVQTWDGTPKRVTVTTEPAGLDIRVLYDGGTNAPTTAGPHRVTVEAADERVEGHKEFTMMIVESGEYLVVDLSGGPEAERYPARRLDGIPAGGWSDEHKESTLALRWIPAGITLSRARRGRLRLKTPQAGKRGNTGGTRWKMDLKKLHFRGNWPGSWKMLARNFGRNLKIG